MKIGLVVNVRVEEPLVRRVDRVIDEPPRRSAADGSFPVISLYRCYEIQEVGVGLLLYYFAQLVDTLCSLNIKVLDKARVGFYELAARLYLVTHKY